MSRRTQPRELVIAGLTPLVNTASAELVCGPALRKIQCGFASKKPINLLVARCRMRVLLKSATTLKIRKDFWQVKCQRRRNQAIVGGIDANAGRLSFPSEHGPRRSQSGDCSAACDRDSRWDIVRHLALDAHSPSTLIRQR